MKVNPEPIIYDKTKYAKQTVQGYAKIIRNKHFKRCSFIGCKTGSRLDVHHINHDVWDNRLDNLAPMCHKHHMQQHDRWNKGLTKENDSRVKKLSKKISLYQQTHPKTLSERHKKILIKINTGKHHNEKTRKKFKEYWAKPSSHKNASIHRKKFWSNPENKKRMSKINSKAQSKPSIKLQTSIRMKLYWSNPENRKRQSLRIKKWIRENTDMEVK